MACLCIFFVFLIILAQAVAFFFFYDLPTKLDTYSKAVGQMREQQDGMKREARHLESERHLLESERHSLEHEEEALKKERERWEKALEDRVPQGAFWDGVWPALDCRAYGKREYWGVLQNIPDDWTDLDACMNMPVKIKGVSVRRPDRCAYVEGSPHIHGFWIVDWGQLDCQPWLKDFEDKVRQGKPWWRQRTTRLTNICFKGCTNLGSGTRRIEAWVMQIKDIPEQDWHLLCESMPLTYNHVTYKRPTYCDTRVSTVSTFVCAAYTLTELLAFSRLEGRSRSGIFPTQVVDFIERVGQGGY